MVVSDAFGLAPKQKYHEWNDKEQEKIPFMIAGEQ
jgi:hypothetical protein